MSNARMKLAKNEAKAKQQFEAELLLFENYWVFSSTLSYKVIYNKKIYKNQVWLFKWGYIINYNENEAQNEK